LKCNILLFVPSNTVTGVSRQRDALLFSFFLLVDFFAGQDCCDINTIISEGTTMKKKIGIIGSGIVGQTLANGFAKHGYEVMIGTNTPAKRDELKSKTGGRAAVGSFEETARFGEILVLATKGLAAESALKAAGIANLSGKTVIDTTNPIADAPPVNGVLQFFTTVNESLMERLQRLAPEARFVKSFNCIGNSSMVNPDFGAVKPTMFICGNSDEAKAEVKRILELFGFDIEDDGKVEGARAIEPLCILWCIPGFLGNRWTHAFALLKK
jgi:predicted dinucleotide-binding enzyme